MRKIVSWFNSYDEEYSELFSHLTKNWQMKPHYAKAFLDTYKKNIGKMFSKGQKRMSQLRDSSPLSYFALGVDAPDLVLVGQAYQAYMVDLRRGRHIGTPVEMAIWAILANRSDVLDGLDRGFSSYIDETYEEMFPGLLEEVFDVSIG